MDCAYNIHISTTPSTTIEEQIVSEYSIAEQFTEPTYTPYKVAKVVNKVLEDLGVDKVLPPQMFYTYAKKGYLTGVKEAKVITRDEAIGWTEKYVVKYIEVSEEA
jgi:hypothetical protein